MKVYYDNKTKGVLMSILEIISLVASVASIILAVFAMIYAKYSSEQSQRNFDKTQELLQKNYENTQKVLQDNYDKTKDVLAEIDKKSAIIDSVVQKNQDQLMQTMTNLLKETVIPKKVDPAEQMGMLLFQKMLQDPVQCNNMLKGIKSISETMNNTKK